MLVMVIILFILTGLLTWKGFFSKGYGQKCDKIACFPGLECSKKSDNCICPDKQKKKKDTETGCKFGCCEKS